MSVVTGPNGSLAARITRSASTQTYLTIRLFTDRGRVEDAYRAYAYFRWVDDFIDADNRSQNEAATFIARQQHLLASCYEGGIPDSLCPEEQMLADMIRNDQEAESGLKIYLCNMMWVMAFDAERRGQTISQSMLDEYSYRLAVAVTEALYHFIGHDQSTPMHEARYQAVEAAHIVHMLRDTYEDTTSGYYNIPDKVLRDGGISQLDIGSPAYRSWVCSRIQLAHSYFKAGRQATASVKSLRCRLAGYAYIARFEWMLRTIERENYCLRAAYPERKSLWAGLQIAWSTLCAAISPSAAAPTLAAEPVRIERK